jgi:hypothetical protein
MCVNRVNGQSSIGSCIAQQTPRLLDTNFLLLISQWSSLLLLLRLLPVCQPKRDLYSHHCACCRCCRLPPIITSINVSYVRRIRQSHIRMPIRKASKWDFSKKPETQSDNGPETIDPLYRSDHKNMKGPPLIDPSKIRAIDFFANQYFYRDERDHEEECGHVNLATRR